MKRKSFTLIEILVALIILSILASLSVAAYQKTVNTNNERICAENLKVLQAAIDIYTVENDALPTALAQLTPRQIYLAYSRVIGERKENPLSIAFRKIFSTEQALAEPLSPAEQGEIFKSRYLVGNIKAFRDPADRNYQGDPSAGCAGNCGSYTFVSGDTIFDPTTNRLRKFTSPGVLNNAPLIYDTNEWHRGKLASGTGTYRLGITPGGRVGKMEGSITSTIQQFL